jgi:3-methyladenine DNA glycosylase AlkD
MDNKELKENYVTKAKEWALKQNYESLALEWSENLFN